ncbi:PDZK1-interacting protein 1-like isoform X2 [Arapaima gigas]
MKKVRTAFLLVFLTLGAVAAQQGDTKRALEPWMTGIIAVAVFLFLVFVAFLVNKAWCHNSSNEPKEESGRGHEFIVTKENTYSTTLSMTRIGNDKKAFDNVAAEQLDEVITPM